MVKRVEDGPTCNSFGGIVDSRDEECKKKGWDTMIICTKR